MEKPNDPLSIRELKALQAEALAEYHRIYLELEARIKAKRKPASRTSDDPNWIYTDAGRNELPRHG